MKKIKILLVAAVAAFSLVLGISTTKVFADTPYTMIQMGNGVNTGDVISSGDEVDITYDGQYIRILVNGEVPFNILDLDLEGDLTYYGIRLVPHVNVEVHELYDLQTSPGERFPSGNTIDIKYMSGSFKIFINNVDRTNYYQGIDNGFTLKFDGTNDNKSPVVSGQTTFVTNVNDGKPISFFLSYLSAYDETDGVVPVTVVSGSDNYTANRSVLGNHTFKVQASDLSGNITEATINVRVVDIDAPTITGNTSVATIGYTETWNINSFKSTLNVSDNYDTLTHQDIGIKSDGYTSKKTTLGTYTVVFNVFDSSDNEGTFSKSVRVVDNVKPTFSGPTTISTSNNTLLSESDVRAQLTASDFIDGNVTNKITLVEDNYTGKGNKVGSYTIIYSVADNAGNTATHTVTIQRIDEIPPTIWVVDGVSIRVTPTTPIDRETIIAILEATGQLTVNATTTFSFPLDEYSGNEETPGIYSMSIKSRSTTGNEYIHSFSIQVLDVDGEDDGIVITEKTWLQENIVLVSVVGVIGLAGLVLYFRKRR